MRKNMIYEMKVQEVYFNKIKSGQKIYEVRLFDDKRRKLKVGDFILFQNFNDLNQTVKVKIENLINFKSFKEMANSILNKDLGLENENIERIVEIYHQFYSVEDEKKFGVLAIKIKKQ